MGLSQGLSTDGQEPDMDVGIDTSETAETTYENTDNETVLISKEHAAVIQEQMKEYYALLDAFDHMKSRNAHLEKELVETRRASGRELSEDAIKAAANASKDTENTDLEHQIDGLKNMVANLRTEYERNLSTGTGNSSRKLRPKSQRHNSVDGSVRSAPPQSRDVAIPRFPSRMVSNLRFETSDESATGTADTRSAYSGSSSENRRKNKK